MNVLITPIDSVIKVESIAVIDKSSVNKLNNPVNADRIHGHLKDIHAKHEIVVTKDGMEESHLSRIVSAVTEHDIKIIKSQHSSFLEHVYNMPEIEVNLPAEIAHQVNEEDEKHLKAASEMLKRIDEEFEDNDTLIIGDHIGPFFTGFCEVKVAFFKEIIDAYIDKKMNAHES